MSKIEEIMSSKDLDMNEKMNKVKDFYKLELSKFSCVELFEGLKRIEVSIEFKDKYRDIPVQYVEALKKAIKELLAEKLSSPEEKEELSRYFDKEIEEAKRIINKSRQELLTPEEIKEKSAPLTEEEFNYKRLAVAYKEGNIDENGEALIENEINKSNSIVATDTIKLINDYKKNIKK